MAHWDIHKKKNILVKNLGRKEVGSGVKERLGGKLNGTLES